MGFFKQYLAWRKKEIFIFFFFCSVFLCEFLLCHLPAGAILYPAAVCGLFGFLILLWDYRKACEKHKSLKQFMELPEEMADYLPESESMTEEDYQNLVKLLLEQRRQAEEQMNGRYADMVEYYTTWVHQIKTPIASMRLKLQNEDSRFSRLISEDLFRIEQYVEMVLCYLRLDSESTDYVFREYELDDIIRQAVKRFAGQFISRKIRLDYYAVNKKIVTDEKWLLFVLEQVLSNALKYTEEGSISIYCEKQAEAFPGTASKEPAGQDNAVLCIRDTGIGIAPEDLPRIFERGYTGYNGRNDKKASGLGLYLCRRICKNLGHTITIDSVLGEGTTVRISLEHRKLEVE